MTTLREAAQQALEALDEWREKGGPIWQCDPAIDGLRTALADHECPNCASLEEQNTELDRKLAEIEASKGVPAALMTTWVSETEAVTEPLYKAPRRLTDTEIGEVWFAAKIPGLTESNARRLIRAVEARSGVR